MTDQIIAGRKFNSELPDLNVTDTAGELHEKVLAHIEFALEQLKRHAAQESEEVKNHPSYSPHVSVRLGVVLDGLDHEQLGESHAVLFEALERAFIAAKEANARVIDVEGYGVTTSSKSGPLLSLRVTVTPASEYARTQKVLADGLVNHVAGETLKSLFGDDDDDLPEGFTAPIH